MQWLFQPLITPPSWGAARLASPMHGSLVAVAGAVGVDALQALPEIGVEAPIG